MQEVTHAGQLKVLQDLLKIKETDGILRVFGNKGSDHYTLEGYWYFPTEGKEDLSYAIERSDLDTLAEVGEIKLYRSENSKAIYDIEITDKGEQLVAQLCHGKSIANWACAN